MKKYKSILMISFLSICFLLIILSFLCIYFLPIKPKSPVIPANQKWYSSINNMFIESYYDSELQSTFLSGTIMIDDDIIDLEIRTRAGILFFHCEQFSLIMTADYKLNKEGDIILKDIDYNEEVDWQTTPKKIILEQSNN